MFSTYQRLGLHVSATDREVIRQSLTKIAPRYRRDPEYRRERKLLYTAMLHYHHGAQRLHRKVVSGDFS